MAKFTELTARTLQESLSNKLLGVTDNIRDLRTRFGTLTHTVALVWLEWSGDVRGRGAATVKRRELLLPVPLVEGIGSLAQSTAAVGSEEDGSIKVKEISGRYTLDMLNGVEPGETESLPNVEFFYEVVEVHAVGSKRPRRFTVSGVPEYEAAPPGWTVTLTRAHDDPDSDSNSRE